MTQCSNGRASEESCWFSTDLVNFSFPFEKKGTKYGYDRNVIYLNTPFDFVELLSGSCLLMRVTFKSGSCLIFKI